MALDPVVALLLIIILVLLFLAYKVLETQASLASFASVVPIRECRCQNRFMCPRAKPTPLVVPAALTDSEFSLLREAAFCLVGPSGDPISCGFFVTSGGVALTAGHNLNDTRVLKKKDRKVGAVVRAINYVGTAFALAVIDFAVGGQDIAVLRLVGHGSVPFLPLPDREYSLRELIGRAVRLIHGNIAYSQQSDALGDMARSFSQNNGHITTVTQRKIVSSIATSKGDSGGALLLRGTQVVGIHCEGLNDLPEAFSENSPMTSAEAIRLDQQCVRDAVAASSQ